MKKYQLYRPTNLIDDVRKPSSYFQAADVLATPFTRLSDLTDDRPDMREQTIIPKNHHPVRTHAVFPTGFMLRLDPTDPAEDMSSSNEQGSKYRLLLVPIKWLASLGAFLATLHPFSTKYVADKGIVRKPSEPMRRFSAVMLPMLAVITLIAVLIAAEPGPSVTPESPIYVRKSAQQQSGQVINSDTQPDPAVNTVAASPSVRPTPKKATASAQPVTTSVLSPVTTTDSGATVTDPTTGGMGGVTTTPTDPGTSSGGTGSGTGSGTGTGGTNDGSDNSGNTGTVTLPSTNIGLGDTPLVTTPSIDVSL